MSPMSALITISRCLYTVNKFTFKDLKKFSEEYDILLIDHLKRYSFL